jgi:Family of unknown function (DUF6186)/Family of unknown function (DUF6256)
MIGLIGWAVIFAIMLAWEGVGLVKHHSEWPTLSDMLRAVTRPTAGRWLMFAVWLWIGWHLFIRGWDFFLAGQIRAPLHADANPKPPHQLWTQVIIPLAGFYVMFAGLLVANRRPPQAIQRPRHGSALARYALRTTLAGYLLFVAIIGLYSLIAGSWTSGFFRSSIWGGAFLGFVAGVPAFLVLSTVEARVRQRHDAGIT